MNSAPYFQNPYPPQSEPPVDFFLNYFSSLHFLVFKVRQGVVLRKTCFVRELIKKSNSKAFGFFKGHNFFVLTKDLNLLHTIICIVEPMHFITVIHKNQSAN